MDVDHDEAHSRGCDVGDVDPQRVRHGIRQVRNRRAAPMVLAGLEVRREALGPELAADARLLEPAERAAELEHEAVDGVGAGAHRVGRPRGAACGVGGPHRAGQAVVGVVGDADRVVDVVVGDHRQHRAEDLLLGDRHLVVDVDEDGRLDVPARGRARAGGRRRRRPSRPLPGPWRCSPRPGRAGARRRAGRRRSRGRADRRPAAGPPRRTARRRRSS